MRVAVLWHALSRWGRRRISRMFYRLNDASPPPAERATPYEYPMQKLAFALLVDDDQTNNFINQLLLKRLGVADELLVALNGQEALKMLLAHCQDAHDGRAVLILLDVKMPVMDGFAFLEAYDKLPLPQKQAITIVMLTSSLHPRDVDRAKQLNIAGFLNKPLTKEKVNEVLRNHCGQHLLAE